MTDQPTTTTIRDLYCIGSRADSCAFVIFGASGDLTGRKLVPSLFSLYQKQLLPEKFFILGCARTVMTDQSFRDKLAGALKAKFGNDPAGLEEFLTLCHYLPGQYEGPSQGDPLPDRLKQLEKSFDTGGNRLFYLATIADLYTTIAQRLKRLELTDQAADIPWRKVVVEKPFGYDLASARTMNSDLRRCIDERQIYRIDHYLGKDTVQNIFILRFANAVFEPIWSRQYIDHVQITVAESIGVEHRAGYFEQTGLLRDMFQNHMLEMLALVAQEPPVSFHADRVRDEKTKLLRSIRPLPLDQLDRWMVTGQYGPGQIDGRPVVGYCQEQGVLPSSPTETFVALKLLIDNWRWQGVPFYLRSGKRLARRCSQIAIQFKNVPHSVFLPLTKEDLSANTLVLNVQPQEGMALTIQAKRPGPKLCFSELTLQFKYRDVFGAEVPDAYERIILDCMLGDQTLFVRFDGMEEAWSLFTPTLDAWSKDITSKTLCSYDAGSWGPAEADALLRQDGRRWREL